jgi:hypothetical protein
MVGEAPTSGEVNMRSMVLAVALLSAVTMAACSPVGSPEPRSTWTHPSAGTLVAYAGEEHCGWQSATVLRLDDNRQYVRDPEGVVSKQWLASVYDPRATLPADATKTGYTYDRQQLWLSIDESAAFIVDGTTTEQWPRTLRGWGCD